MVRQHFTPTSTALTRQTDPAATDPDAAGPPPTPAAATVAPATRGTVPQRKGQ
ncbi:hypothetical protein GCM10027615_45960 [Plantactinospora veratri]